MAYDPYIAERIERIFEDKKVSYKAKKMMGGLAYMVSSTPLSPSTSAVHRTGAFSEFSPNDFKMCVGIMSEKEGRPSKIMARIGPKRWSEALQKEGCHEMTFTGRSMKGYVFVDFDAVETDEELEYWIQLCLDFNPFAKTSKKRKKKA